jgi:hypothetical protein
LSLRPIVHEGMVVAIKAYEAMEKRVMDAVHQPVTQPTTLHF